MKKSNKNFLLIILFIALAMLNFLGVHFRRESIKISDTLEHTENDIQEKSLLVQQKIYDYSFNAILVVDAIVLLLIFILPIYYKKIFKNKNNLFVIP